jgi:hypothetical protein
MFADELIMEGSFDSVLQLYVPEIRQSVLFFSSQIAEIITYLYEFQSCSLTWSFSVAEEIGVEIGFTELDHLMANHILLLIMGSDCD